MFETQKLFERLDSELGRRNIEKIAIPPYLTNNLKHQLFPWQKKALQYFLAYHDPQNGFLAAPTHLMFNLATGAGKTLLMAAALLYYYHQGRRHFLFFVNRNNIVAKTEDNFINPSHPKYLFKPTLVIRDRPVFIKKVDTFSQRPLGIEGIEIKFTSIHKLHEDLHTEKENQLTLEELHRYPLVLLADEAHHLNTETKKQVQGTLGFETTPLKRSTAKEEVERRGWEHTVIELVLNRRAGGSAQRNSKADGNKNVLLEFTATLPTAKGVEEKYRDKIITQFELKDFLRAGYTKEIVLFSSQHPKKQRVLLALLFSWYRHQVALRHGLANFKPVTLFRSKTIKESKADYEEFLKWMQELSGDDFGFCRTALEKILTPQQPQLFESGQSRLQRVLRFIAEQSISFTAIADWMRHSYQPRNTVITNSKTNPTQREKTGAETEKLLNSLEAPNNPVRAIFTVERLTEGWDVLNLFDIVRLYEGRDEGKASTGTRKTGSATTAEKQLIGRGVRYYPFSYQDKTKHKRKFDQDLDHELRVLEELYFHSTSESKYLSELKRALREEGLLDDDRIPQKFALKDEFEKTDFYKNTKVWYNCPEDNPERRKTTLEEVKKNFHFSYRVKGAEVQEEKVELQQEASGGQPSKPAKSAKARQSISKTFGALEKHIVRKAINIKAQEEDSLFRFDNLKKELAVHSTECLTGKKMLGDFSLNLILSEGATYDTISNGEKLAFTKAFLEQFALELKKWIVPKKGSEFRAGSFAQFFATPKTKLTLKKEFETSAVIKNITEEKWYVLDTFVGTSEEAGLIQFIQEHLGNLQERYNEFYLLRNEEVYKLYDFEKGRGFQPDFLLFLKTKYPPTRYYQVLIEAKGEQYKDLAGNFDSSREGWKEKFLEEISKWYGDKNIITAENKKYRLFGLPFFNEGSKKGFDEEFYRVLLPPKSETSPL